jgi:hypothetical protein
LVGGANFDIGINGYMDETGRFSHKKDLQCSGSESFDQKQTLAGFSGRFFDSFLSHMTSSVIAEYATRGFTNENWIISRAARESDPVRCTFDSNAYGNAANWVNVISTP